MYLCNVFPPRKHFISLDTWIFYIHSTDYIYKYRLFVFPCELCIFADSSVSWRKTGKRTAFFLYITQILITMPRNLELEKNRSIVNSTSTPRSAKTVSERLILKLTKEKEQLSLQIEDLQRRLDVCRAISKQETELKNSCFSFLVHTKQYKAWEEYKKTEEAKSALKFLMSNIN